MYFKGLGLPTDLVEAARWYRAAAEQGVAEAQFSLGFMYEAGSGVPKDADLAALWYRRAADQGNADAQHNLGLLYAHGRGVPKDRAEASRWLERAARHPGGYKRMALSLGVRLALWGATVGLLTALAWWLWRS